MANNKLKGLNPQQELLLHAIDQLCKSAVVDGHGRIMSQSAMDLFYVMNIGLDDKPYHKREMQDMKETIMKLHHRSMVDEDVPIVPHNEHG